MPSKRIRSKNVHRHRSSYRHKKTGNDASESRLNSNSTGTSLSRSANDIERELFKIFGDDLRSHLSISFEIETVRSSKDDERNVTKLFADGANVPLRSRNFEKKTLRSADDVERDLLKIFGDESNKLESPNSSDSEESIAAVTEILNSERFNGVELRRLEHLLGEKSKDNLLDKKSRDRMPKDRRTRIRKSRRRRSSDIIKEELKRSVSKPRKENLDLKSLKKSSKRISIPRERSKESIIIISSSSRESSVANDKYAILHDSQVQPINSSDEENREEFIPVPTLREYSRSLSRTPSPFLRKHEIETTKRAERPGDDASGKDKTAKESKPQETNKLKRKTHQSESESESSVEVAKSKSKAKVRRKEKTSSIRPKKSKKETFFIDSDSESSSRDYEEHRKSNYKKKLVKKSRKERTRSSSSVSNRKPQDRRSRNIIKERSVSITRTDNLDLKSLKKSSKRISIPRERSKEKVIYISSSSRESSVATDKYATQHDSQIKPVSSFNEENREELIPVSTLREYFRSLSRTPSPFLRKHEIETNKKSEIPGDDASGKDKIEQESKPQETSKLKRKIHKSESESECTEEVAQSINEAKVKRKKKLSCKRFMKSKKHTSSSDCDSKASSSSDSEEDRKNNSKKQLAMNFRKFRTLYSSSESNSKEEDSDDNKKSNKKRKNSIKRPSMDKVEAEVMPKTVDNSEESLDESSESSESDAESSRDSCLMDIKDSVLYNKLYDSAQ